MKSIKFIYIFDIQRFIMNFSFTFLTCFQLLISSLKQVVVCFHFFTSFKLTSVNVILSAASRSLGSACDA